MRHPTYKHLEAHLRLGSFSLGQWVQIGAAAAAAAVFGVYVSPFPPSLTVFLSIVAAGMPVAVSYGAMGLEFSVADLAVAAWRYWRHPRSYLPGPGTPKPGYVVRCDVARAGRTGERSQVDGTEPLWDF